MTTSPISSTDLSSLYGAASTTGGSSSSTASSTSALPTQDSVTLQFDTALLSSVYPQANTTVAGAYGYPTNIQQAVENQTILATDSDLYSTLSQAAASPALEPLAASLETLQATGSASTSSTPSMTSLISSMQVLQNIASAGTMTSNPTLAQSVLASYTSLTNVPSIGSLVDTSA